MDETRIEKMPEADFGSVEEQLRRVIQLLNVLIDGAGNHHYFVTLVEGEIETEVLAPGIRPGAVVTMTARNAEAASETGFWAEVRQDKLVIHHAASPGERQFSVVTNG